MATYGSEKIEALANNKAIIRNRLKIKAAIRNAAVFIEIQQEYGSFAAYIRHFTGGKRIVNRDGIVRATSPLSDRVSADLKKRGMKFVGSTIIYSYLQSVGVIDDHEPGCACALQADRIAGAGVEEL